MLYPQNGARIMTIDSVTSFHPMYITAPDSQERRNSAVGVHHAANKIRFSRRLNVCSETLHSRR